MATLQEKAKAQFAEKLLQVGEHFVEEWDDTIYFRVSTLKERNEIISRSKGGDLDVIVETVIARSRNAIGERLFVRANKVEMMREYDPEILAEIVLAMGKFDSELKESAGN